MANITVIPLEESEKWFQRTLGMLITSYKLICLDYINTHCTFNTTEDKYSICKKVKLSNFSIPLFIISIKGYNTRHVISAQSPWLSSARHESTVL